MLMYFNSFHLLFRLKAYCSGISSQDWEETTSKVSFTHSESAQAQAASRVPGDVWFGLESERPIEAYMAKNMLMISS